MKIVSFNVNSLRQRLHQLQSVIDKHAPEFIGLQETKVQDHEFPLQAIDEMGYQVLYMGQKTHYGVALLSRHSCTNPRFGFPGDGEDAQKRFIGGEFVIEGDSITVFNGYFPQGESRDHAIKFPAKQRFYHDLTSYLGAYDMARSKLIVMGDYNIAPQDVDIGIGEDNAKRWLKTGKTSFLPEEREWFQRLTSLGLYDGFRLCNETEDNCFSWFDYRSKGFDREPKRGLRIDHLLVSELLRPAVVDAGVDYDIRAMQKPSDHAPTWIELNLNLRIQVKPIS
ncbi:MAG: exodeoxyribonuclease III [Gammaproteobacteria bacterium]|nr:exodeoxyribonuclease III [Gammaproteobacteria bacterium]